MAQGLINNGVSVTKSFSPNEYELIGDYTVSGSAITSYTFSGLKLNADEEIVLVFDIYNSTGSNSEYQLLVNGNTTTTNYYFQQLLANGTSVVGERTNSSRVSFGYPSSKNAGNVHIKLTNNGYFTYQSCGHFDYATPTDLRIFDVYNTSTFTLSQITSLTVASSTASAIGIGSRFQLYKVKGQVQQTWATT